MKFLFLSIIIVGLFVGQINGDDESCQKCFDLSDILFKSFQLDNEVQDQVQFLQDFVCPLMGDESEVSECYGFIAKYWGRMIKIVVEDSVTTRGVCDALGYCEPAKKHRVKIEIECEECRQFLAGVALFLPDEFGMFYIIDILASEAFCGAADISPDRPDKIACRQFVQEFIPLAVPLLAEKLLLGTDYLCQTYFQTCKK